MAEYRDLKLKVTDDERVVNETLSRDEVRRTIFKRVELVALDDNGDEEIVKVLDNNNREKENLFIEVSSNRISVR